MSMVLADADAYISRILGGSNSTDILAQARDAMKAAMERLSLLHSWSFLRQDTSQSFTVANCTDGAGAILTTATANGFASVLKGMTVTGTGIVADTIVASVESTTSITLSLASTASSATITFGGTIPIISAVDTYVLPTRFHKPYSCRLVSASKRPLRYVPQGLVDIVTYDQAIAGGVVAYTLYNPTNFDAAGTQQAKIKFFRVPDVADVALLRYYRPFDGTLATVDCSERCLYVLLDLASLMLLQRKDATNPRIPALIRDMLGNDADKVGGRVGEAIGSDRIEAGEDTVEQIYSPNEMRWGMGFDGDFYPRGDVGY